jgi:exodeoxyribonuclease VII small subunit
MQNKNIGFEASMERLEKIVAELSREGITLDESLALYEEGIALAKNCNARLEENERKIKILKFSEYGEISEQDFSEK